MRRSAKARILLEHDRRTRKPGTCAMTAAVPYDRHPLKGVSLWNLPTNRSNSCLNTDPENRARRQSTSPPSWNPIVEPNPQGDGSYLVGDWSSGTDTYLEVMAMQWDLPQSLGTIAHIDSVRLTIPYRSEDSLELAVMFLHADYEIWSRDREDLFLDIALLLSDAVQTAVDDGQDFFSLLIGGSSAYADKVWKIKPTDVLLEVYHTPPESVLIDSVIITNVVDGTIGWDLLPESRVRGDLNAFDVNGWADYSQMPHFEPPYTMLSWEKYRYHLTETWYAKFEHQSFNGRRKFRHWNGSDPDYGVADYTPPFYGDTKVYHAETDTVYQTRNLVKREITSSYDGLSFDFKDPWRVEQNLNAGGPDSAQYVRDGFNEQFSPYEPWSDSQSWGVFTEVKKEGNPHYATRYWRYYDYDAGTDSYTRKDGLPLDEGDLIHMDEISQGKGMEVSPAGSIEYSDVTGTASSSRDYNLEYKDGSQTMDLTAVFKAHLLSNRESQPTRSVNQRKLDIGPDSVYHMVYESAGEVWYTQSANGQTWSPEELVSDYSHTAANPSLDVVDSSVYVTFYEDGYILPRRRYRNAWHDIMLYETSRNNNGSATTPVVGVGQLEFWPLLLPGARVM